jgi:hypothetical protein
MTVGLVSVDLLVAGAGVDGDPLVVLVWKPKTMAVTLIVTVRPARLVLITWATVKHQAGLHTGSRFWFWFRAVRTFYTSSSRADTARTRRRLLRPALAPAPLRERAGRLARDTG